MIGPVEGSSAAEHFRAQAQAVTTAVTQGETEASDKALKMIAVQKELEAKADQFETAENVLDELLG